jgi:hypothetical protein
MQMENFVKDIKQSIDIEIQRIEQLQIDTLDKIKQTIAFIQSSLTLLKQKTADYQFESPQEEILFFKVWKPQVFSLLAFYIHLYRIEKHRAEQSLTAQFRYLKAEYETLKRKPLDNSFYSYYQTGQTDLDTLYFRRGHYDIYSDAQCNFLNKDISFSTMHDSSVAEILADKHLAQYLSKEIDALSDKLHFKLAAIIEEKQLQWTESKVALVEFIYALYAGKCLNNGDSSLKDIAFCCELLFNIEIGDFYRIFLEIRNRKKNRTQFLDKLKEKIIKMMDELDK